MAAKESELGGNDGKAPYFTLKADQVVQNFAVQAEERAIAFDANTPIEASSLDETWCKVKVLNGTTMNRITFTITQNTGLDVRSTKVTVTAKGCEPVDIEVNQLGEGPAILVNREKFDMDQYGGYAEFEVTTNVDVVVASADDWIVEAPKQDAASKTMVMTAYRYKVAMLADGAADRVGKITVSPTPGAAPVAAKEMVVNQVRSTAPDPVPDVDPNDFPDVKKLKLANAKLLAGRAQEGQGADKAIDGNKAVIFHSPWVTSPDFLTAADNLVSLEFEFEDKAASVDYIELTTRNNNTGMFTQGTVWFKTASSPEYTLAYTLGVDGEYKPAPSTTMRLNLKQRIEKPTHMRLDVVPVAGPGAADIAAGAYFVTLAELEVFVDGTIGALDKYTNIFADKALTVLKPGVTIPDIRAIDNPTIRGIALQLFEGTYATKYRVHNVAPLRPIEDLAKELMTSSYNRYENPTGMYLKKGETALIFVGDTYGRAINLLTADFSRDKQPNASYALAQGVNKIDITEDGNAYISYFTSDYKTAEPITVHIVSSTINGYFDVNRDTNADWVELLANATSPIMDIKGEYVNAAFHVAKFLENCPSNGLELAQLYDRIVLEEFKMMGLEKYNRIPQNNMFMYVSTDANTAAAGGVGAMFPPNWGEGGSRERLTNIEDMTIHSWVIGHELGHVNQTRRGFKFAGMDECTNNLLASWVQYVLDKDTRRLETMNRTELVGAVSATNPAHYMEPFNCMLNNSMIRGDLWIHTEGHLRKETITPGNPPGTDGGDFFARLIPYYQYWMYFQEAKGKPYIYADVFENVRTKSAGLNQSGNGDDTEHFKNIMKWMCDAVETDMTPYFTKMKMLEPRYFVYGSYGASPILNVKQSDIDEVKTYCSKYNQLTDVIEYINQNNYPCFRDRLSVSGTKETGFTVDRDGFYKIDHAVWKNAVGFRTYSGQKLVRAVVSGTGDPSGANYTLVRFPQGSTKIVAVAYNGTEVTVMDRSGNIAGGFEDGSL